MKKFLRLFAPMALLLTGLQQATAASLATYWNIVKSNSKSYCGIIYLLTGDERLAYQRI